MSTPAITTLLAVHNGAQTIDRCLTSIERQTIRSWKIVCVDDASTDLTSSRLKYWKKRLGTRLTVLRNAQNQGLTRSLNAGLDRIHSPYVARIDADDWWHPEKLARQLEFLESHPGYGVIGCNYVNVSKQGERTVQLWEHDVDIRRAMAARNPFAHSCIVFETKLVQRLGGYDSTVRYGQDYDLWWRCYPETKFYNLQEILCYRAVGSGISVSKQRQQMLQCARTQHTYFQKYHLPLVSYRHLIEPLLVAYTPAFLRKLKRAVLG